MLPKFINEAVSQRSINRINALSNAALSTAIVKAKKSMDMVYKQSLLHADNDMARLFLEMYLVSKKGYDCFATWWFYASYCLKKLNRKKEIKVKLKKGSVTINVNIAVTDDSKNSVGGSYNEDSNTVQINLFALPTTYKTAKTFFNDKQKVQESILKIRTAIVHELRHFFLKGAGMDNYRYSEETDWDSISLPKHFAYAMYVFLENELESRFEEAVKYYREKRKVSSVHLNVLVYFVNMMMDDMRYKRRSFVDGNFVVGLSPIQTILMQWCILVWLPEWSPSVKNFRQWKMFYEQHKDKLPLIKEKVKILNQIADIALNQNLTPLAKSMIEMDIEETFGLDGEDWWDSDEFEETFASLGGMKKFLKCIE